MNDTMDTEDAANDEQSGRLPTTSPMKFPINWTAPNAPAQVPNPLWHLEGLLQRQKQSRELLSTSARASNKESDQDLKRQLEEQRQERINEILETVDFLYGSKLLTNALALVDCCHSFITQVVAPSGRRAHLIRGSEVDKTYLCLCSSPASATVSYAGSVHYCSCRSFYESTSKVSVGSIVHHNHNKDIGSNESATLGAEQPPNNQISHYSNVHLAKCPPLCKHLLALKLLPYLEEQDNSTNKNGPQNGGGTLLTKCHQIKTVTEEEFANLLLHHVGFQP